MASPSELMVNEPPFIRMAPVESVSSASGTDLIPSFSIISVGSIVDHDTVVGKCAHINAGSIVKAGGVVEEYRKLQAGEVVLGY